MSKTAKPDGRQRPRFKPPQRIGKRPVTVYLDPEDYRALYERALTANTSLQEVLRGLIRGPSHVPIDVAWVMAQLSLDMCVGTPFHALSVQINGEGPAFRWYRRGKPPACRRPAGANSMMIEQDCGSCEECRPPRPLTVFRLFPQDRQP